MGSETVYIVFSDGIYENASVLKSNNSNMLTPVTTAIEKYEFGQDNVSDNDDHDHEDDATVEQEQDEEESANGGVSFQVRLSEDVVGLDDDNDDV